MKMHTFFAGASASLFVLSGCVSNGGSSPTTAPYTPSSANYQTLDSTEAVTSVLKGVGSQTGYTGNTITSASTLTILEGTLTHDTGATTLSDGTYTLTDVDGLNDDNELDDGNGLAVQVTDDMAQGGNYNYVGVYTYVYTVDGEDFVGTYVGGLATTDRDMPTSGSARYSGQNVGFYASGTGDSYDFNGSTTVNADFGAGTANVSMHDFQATDGTGAGATMPMDTLNINGMNIDGSSMTGGDLVALNNGTEVDILGANSDVQSQGQFFGYDDDISAPDEVGGLLLGEGDDGFVQTVYIAD